MNSLAKTFSEGHPLFLNMGITLVSFDKGKVVMRMPYQQKLSTAENKLHGGAITTVLDSASGLCIILQIGQMTPVATVDLRIDYFKDIEPETDLLAMVECINIDSDIAYTRGVAYHKSLTSPVALATGAFSIMHP